MRNDAAGFHIREAAVDLFHHVQVVEDILKTAIVRQSV
jgi:hypothetical protein